ncbi:MAG: glycoside hydrolase family 2 TIM barrel-domain containing protein, partial [Acutalibacteraceae bacterium]
MNKRSFHKNSAFKKLTAMLMCILMIMSVVPAGMGILAASASSGSRASAASEPRLDLNFNKNWKFNLGENGGAQAKAFDDSTWESVQLPHDFSISQDFSNTDTEVESGNLPGGTGWYRKMFTMPEEYAGKEVILNFDGAYNNAYVYVNGQLVCENHYGYNSFSVNISDYIVCNGSTWNIVAVKVVSEMSSSRWYPGSGLTRDVTMTIVNPVHVSLYGTQVTTENNTTMNAVVTVQNESTSASSVTLKNEILDASDNVVVSDSQSVAVSASSSTDANVSMTVTSPNLWDIDTPYLYTLRTTILDADGNELDVYDTEFGFRTINWDATSGFSLNGTPVKIKGMCMHHDQGALGAAQEYDAIYRQIKILKDMGCNAIRTSHNIPSRVVLEICNELGMLVMEEFFDGWDSYKNGNTNDFSKYFSVNLEASNKVIGGSSSMTWAQFALTQAVKRDRNDPCIILWSCANELGHGSSSANYMTIAAQINSWLDALDPTRPITQGNNQSSLMNVDTYMDVIGGNYFANSWENLKNNGTLTKPFVGTETVSAITTRGVYSYRGDYDGGKLGNEDYTLYSYDNSAVTWGNTAAFNWYYAAKNDWFSGEFVWTGFDYIGEPTPWYSSSAGTSTVPNSSYFGVIDTAGFPKDQYYLYRSWWQTKDTTLHLLPGTWDSSNLYLNNNYAYVNVYSNADHIELYLNDTLIGTAQSTTNTTSPNNFQYKTWTETVVDSNYCNTNKIYSGTGSNLYAQFGVKYTAGTLSVKAYDANNNEITDTVGTKSVSSGTTAAKIVSKVWGENKDNFTADSDSFAYIEFEAVDANGNFVNDYNGTLNVSVNENGEIVGVDNGFQGTTAKFQQSSVLTSATTATIQMFNGRALAIVRTNETPTDDIAVTATTSDSLPVVGSTFTSRAEAGDELSDEFEEVILQSDQSYIASQYDEYEMYKAQIDALEEITTEVQYVLYSVQDTGSGVDYLPSGAYIITGVATNSNAKGVMSNDELTSGSQQGFSSDGSTGTPAADSPTWYFERLSNGKYYIYYFEANQKWYMNLGTTTASLTKSQTPQELTVTVSSSNSTVTIGNGSQYVNYYGSNPQNFVSSWSDGTSLTLYTTDGTTVTAWDKDTAIPVIEDGVYIITNLYNSTLYVVSGSLKSGTTNKISHTTGTLTDNGNVLDTDAANEYTFTNTGDSAYSYYIMNSSGQYLNIGTSNTTISFSDNPQALTVAVLSDGRIGIYNGGSQFLDNYSNDGAFSSWTSTVEGLSENRKMTLYSKQNATAASSEQGELYNALNDAATYAPGTYDAETYNILLAAMADGLSVFNNGEL